jgi:hypothetical protein
MNIHPEAAAAAAAAAAKAKIAHLSSSKSESELAKLARDNAAEEQAQEPAGGYTDDEFAADSSMVLLDRSPFCGVQTERESFVLAKDLPVYRSLYVLAAADAIPP